jgi:hypothetical protein
MVRRSTLILAPCDKINQGTRGFQKYLDVRNLIAVVENNSEKKAAFWWRYDFL